MIITKEQAMKELPYIEDKNLFRAVDLALWLLLTQDRSLKLSVETASRKRNYPVKAHIEQHVRKAVPEEFFWERQTKHAPKVPNAEPNISAQKLAKMEQLDKQHIDSFTKRS